MTEVKRRKSEGRKKKIILLKINDNGRQKPGQCWRETHTKQRRAAGLQVTTEHPVSARHLFGIKLRPEGFPFQLPSHTLSKAKMHAAHTQWAPIVQPHSPDTTCMTFKSQVLSESPKCLKPERDPGSTGTILSLFKKKKAGSSVLITDHYFFWQTWRSTFGVVFWQYEILKENNKRCCVTWPL